MMSDEADVSSEPHRNSLVSLHDITKENWRTVAKLRVWPAQEENLEFNPMSMVEAHYSEDAWMRAIYADDTVVGFLMMALHPPAQRYHLWRLMIDQRYQGLGFGRSVVGMALQHVKENFPQAARVSVRSTPKEGKLGVAARCSPYPFYVKLGFRQTLGPNKDGDVTMEIDL